MDNEGKRQVLPTNVRPTNYNLILTPDLKEFTHKGTEVVNLDINENTNKITLNVIEIEIQSATIENLSLNTISSQKATDISYDKGTVTLTFQKEIIAGTKAALHIEFTGILNDKMAGFYRSSYVDESGNKRYLVTTQFEATDARRAFPCWDEPAIKATFDITLIVPSELTALSNMNVISEKPLADGKKEVMFAKTPIMSTYLLAFVVGDLAYIEKKTNGVKNAGNPVQIRVYATRGNEKNGEFALNVAVEVLEYFAGVFGIPYPLPKLDMVAIPDFEAGKNWGLITYRTAAILFDTKQSDAKFKQRIGYTVSHELAHQGLLLGLDIWLLIKSFLIGIFGHRFQKGLQLDSLKSSHPIEVPVNNPSEIHQIFDAISYYKGASVIRMLSDHLGENIFLSGVRKYLKRHEYGNASTDDLWKALSEESGIDVGKFMTGWTRVVGYPVLFVDEPLPNKIHIRQTRFLSTGVASPEDDTTTWWVPLGIDLGSTGNIDLRTKILTTKEATIDLPSAMSEFLQLNANETGVYRVAYTPERLKKLGKAVENGLLSTSDRIGLVADNGALSMSGYIKTSSLLSFLKEFDNEDKYIVWCEISTQISNLFLAWFEQPDPIHEALLSFRRQLISKLVNTVTWEFSEGEDYLTTMFRTFIIGFAGKSGYPEIVKEARRRFDLLTKHNDESAIHPNIRGTVFDIVLKYGGGEEEFNAIIDIYRKTTIPDQKIIVLASLGSVVQPELIQRSLDFAISDEVKEQDIIYSFSGYAKSVVLFGHVIKFCISSFASEEDIKDIESFFKDKDCKNFARPLQQSLESIRINAAWVNRDADDVKQWLKENKYLE
ncbi:826_t:CDS:10 [Entrophospora sp. SA101]|nr:826_t:CDS:10 [Entrophospora sp. SA101]